MRLRPATIEALARMICGDAPSPFPYRSSSRLTGFFTGLGLDFIHQGESRIPWTRDALLKLNAGASDDEEGLPSEFVSIIEALIDPTSFPDSSEGEEEFNQALTNLNRILSPYKLQVIYDEGSSVCRLRSVDGRYVSTARPEVSAIRKITFCPLVFEIPEEKPREDLAGVMMPFDAAFKPVYGAIKRACSRNHLQCERADDIWRNTAIVQDIFDIVYLSRIIVVDFSGKNANVMYETGIAHTLGKHVIPITQSIDDVPFDLRQHRALKYMANGEGIETLETSLSKRISTLLKRHPWEE